MGTHATDGDLKSERRARFAHADPPAVSCSIASVCHAQCRHYHGQVRRDVRRSGKLRRFLLSLDPSLGWNRMRQCRVSAVSVASCHQATQGRPFVGGTGDRDKAAPARFYRLKRCGDLASPGCCRSPCWNLVGTRLRSARRSLEQTLRQTRRSACTIGRRSALPPKERHMSALIFNAHTGRWNEVEGCATKIDVQILAAG